MATGSGKTVVMGMLIAWQALNKLANPYDKRFSTRFLIVTPGILIRLRDRYSRGHDDLLTLLLEVSGEAKKEKQAKVAAAADLWMPAVNNWGGLGRGAFLEVTQMENASDLIRSRLLRPTPLAEASAAGTA